MSNPHKDTNDIPSGWVQLTRRDTPDELEFAITQLEKSGRKYFIRSHRTDNRISVWVRQT